MKEKSYLFYNYLVIIWILYYEMSKTLQYQCTSFNLIMTNNYRSKNIFAFKIKLHYCFRANFTMWNHNKLWFYAW